MHTKKFLLYATGIFVSYFYYGIFQEKVTRRKYTYETANEKGEKSLEVEKFTYALSLVLIQCVINYVVSKAAILLWPHGDDKTPKLYYASVALTYLLAMVSSNMALQWVAYPTQVIGKSAKPIPVMILGVLLGKRSYPFKKYLFVFLIVGGIVLFMMKDKAVQYKQEEGFFIQTGELLLILSLIMDGLTGSIQERIRAESNPSGVQMMVTANGWSLLYLGSMVALTGEAVEFYNFVQRHPYVVTDILTLGVTSSVGQLCIYSMVSEFGPLPTSLVTTTRKFFTVLGSVIIFGNVISSRQWLGASLVFAGLFLDAYFGKSPKKN